MTARWAAESQSFQVARKVRKRKDKAICGWINEPEMVEFLEVRLVMNTLRRKGIDIIRQLINEPAIGCPMASALDNQGLAGKRKENPIIDQPSQIHSWAND